jgi:hypothetical protein
VMAGEHPSELNLLAYVEDELDEGARAQVETHLAGCETCTVDIVAARRGREAARAASLLEPPSETRERVVRALPAQEPPSRLGGRRWLAVAAPIAATLAVVAGVATLATSVDRDGDGVSGEGGGAAVAEESGGDAAEGGGGTAGPAPALKALEDPRQLARELRRSGFDARVENGTVVVRTERKAALERLLGDYPRDAVRVRVE